MDDEDDDDDEEDEEHDRRRLLDLDLLLFCFFLLLLLDDDLHLRSLSSSSSRVECFLFGLRLRVLWSSSLLLSCLCLLLEEQAASSVIALNYLLPSRGKTYLLWYIILLFISLSLPLSIIVNNNQLRTQNSELR